MKLYSFTQDRSIEQYGSVGASIVQLTHGQTGAFVVCIRIKPGGILGRHLAVSNQLFCVVEGSGIVSGEDNVMLAITAGKAAFWKAGEMHETRSDDGLTAIVLEGEGMLPGVEMVLINN